MAALDTTRPLASATSFGGLLAPLYAAFAAVASWNDARATRKALSQLSKHQMNDIGLTSADIDLWVAKYR